MGLSTAVRILAGAYLASMMFSIGLIVGGQLKASKAVRRHERWLLVRAILMQLVGLPLLAWGILELLHAHGYVAKAILVVSLAPGGRLLPNLTRRAGGELGLSVEITLWLAKLTAFIAPPMLALLGDVHRVHLDDVRIIAALVGIQLVPYIAGRELRRRRSAIAGRLRRPLDLLRGGLVVAVLAIVIAQGKIAALRFVGEVGWAGAFIFATLCLIVGWLVGGRSPGVRRTFALAGNSRDLALALTLATLAYPGLPVELPVFAVWMIAFGFCVLYSELVGRPHRAAEEVLA